MGDGQTEPHTTLNVEVPAYKYAAPKNGGSRDKGAQKWGECKCVTQNREGTHIEHPPQGIFGTFPN